MDGAWTPTTPWRPVPRLRTSAGAWRRFVDRGLQRVRERNPGFVDDSWWLAVAPPSPPERLDTGALVRLRNERGTFLADPIPLVGADDEYLVEEYRFATRRGVISHLRFDEQGRATIRSGIIDAPYHLSFPTTFRHQDTTWIVPEAAASGATHIWEFDADAGSTRYAGELIDHPVRDVVIFEHADRWYLMGTAAVPDWHLVLYTAPDPLGGWEPTPIDNQTEFFRPGGSLIPLTGGAGRDGGGWVAPMQGHTRGYGSELALCELRMAPAPTLTSGPQIDPPDPFIGLHSLALGRSQTLVDLKHLRLRPDRVWHRVSPKRMVRKLTRRGGRA